MRVRTKQIEKDAIQFDGSNWASKVWPWYLSVSRKGDKHKGSFHPDHNGNITIDTLEGRMTARAGDWIIRGVKGELYPCKPDIFSDTYEPTEDRP